MSEEIKHTNIQYPFYAACFVLGIFVGYKFKLPIKRLTYVLTKEPTKLVLVVRDDLKMGKGKIASQCCHGTLLAYKHVSLTNPGLCQQWEMNGQPKVVVRAESLSELLTLEKKCALSKINCQLVSDAGRTQVEHGTQTVLAVGPDYVSIVNKITGQLKLM